MINNVLYVLCLFFGNANIIVGFQSSEFFNVVVGLSNLFFAIVIFPSLPSTKENSKNK